jgi:hypothetical protein
LNNTAYLNRLSAVRGSVALLGVASVLGFLFSTHVTAPSGPTFSSIDLVLQVLAFLLVLLFFCVATMSNAEQAMMAQDGGDPMDQISRG